MAWRSASISSSCMRASASVDLRYSVVDTYVKVPSRIKDRQLARSG